MEFTKRNLVLVKAGLQYGLLHSTSEQESAEFALLLVDVEGAIIREKSPEKKDPFLSGLKEAARKVERAKLAREAMLVLLGQDQAYWLGHREKLVKEAYGIADSFLNDFESQFENKIM